MRKAILMTLVLSCIGAAVEAQITEKVYTSDGSVYEGYISEQVPGERICVYATKATRIALKKDISNLKTVYLPYNSLPESAKNMSGVNGDSTSVALSTFELHGEVIDDVKIVSEDEIKIEYVSFARRSYVLSWGSIEKTEKLFEPKDNYGIRDIITLNDGRQLIGFITEQVLGNTITIKTEDGILQKVNAEDVLSLRSECIDPETSIWHQTLLLDRIVVEDQGQTREIDGFIVARVSGKKLIILNRVNGQEESIAMDKIQRYDKYYNRDYMEYVTKVTDIKPTILVNGLERSLSQIYMEDNKIKVQTKEIDIVNLEVGNILNVKVMNMPCDKSARLFQTQNPKQLFIFSDDQPIYESRFIPTAEGYLECELEINKSGYFFLLINGFESVLVIRVN